jgi:hypothetical protein
VFYRKSRTLAFLAFEGAQNYMRLAETVQSVQSPIEKNRSAPCHLDATMSDIRYLK